MPDSTPVFVPQPGGAARAAELVVDAMFDYPYWRWLEPDSDARADAMLVYYRDDLAHTFAKGTNHAIAAGGALDALAVWLWSDHVSAWDDAVVTATSPQLADRFARAFSVMRSMTPAYPHWYLDLLVVRRARQRQGLGRAVVADGIERADRDCVPCYLETADPATVAFYQRLGFAVTGRQRLDDIEIIGMVRPSRGG